MADDAPEVGPPERDSVAPLVPESGDPPAIVSVSDIHGYLDEGRSALLTVGDHPDYDPVVEEDDEGLLHWADNDYVLVINGDLVDRGPMNAETVEMARRLTREAPPGRVRTTIGNHEMALMLPAIVRWARWYSGQVTTEERKEFYRDVVGGRVVAAYQGYDYVYAHAGRTEHYDAAEINDRLVEGTRRLLDAAGTDLDEDEQKSVAGDYDDIFGTGGRTGRGPGAGITWLDFEHMPPDAPPQIVGHTRHHSPTRKGNVVCQNVIRNNREALGGEAVLVERPGDLRGLIRDADGDVLEISMNPEEEDDGEEPGEGTPSDESDFEWETPPLSDEEGSTASGPTERADGDPDD